MKSRRFTLDLALDNNDPPMPGDYLRGPRAVYRVTESRPVDSRVWGNRWAVTVLRVGDSDDMVVLPDARVLPFASYKRGESPVEFFGTSWPPDGEAA